MGNGDIENIKVEESADSLDWQAYRSLSLQPHGFGIDRIRIWPKLVHVDNRAEGEQTQEGSVYSMWSSETSIDLASLEQEGETTETSDGEPHADERQIELDTDRSFVLYPGVSSRDKLQAALNRLIVSVFRRRPRLHYFQGYHDIVSVVFLTLPKELHLPVTEKLSLHRVRDSMGTNLDPVVGLLRLLQRLLRLADPTFASILDRTAPLPYFALSNLLTLFSHDVPTLPLIQHIFDYLLCRPPIVVVYLAAAFILTRGEEAQVLEEEGEEGMMHSLLTVLPNLYEEGEDSSEVAPAPAPEEQSDPSQPDMVKTEDVSPKLEEAEPLDSGAEADSLSATASSYFSAGSSPDASPDPQTPPEPDHPTAVNTLDNDPPTTEAASGDVSGLGIKIEPKMEPTDHPIPDVINEDEDEKSMLSPEPIERDPRPHRPRISLSALLKHADSLFALYPPTHPSIALASIMGPQSVMLTWSERAAELPDDDEAEKMVMRPELIVLPYVEQEPEEGEEEMGMGEKRRREREREKEERRRRRLRKPRRLTDIVVQRKTMVAGAVLVLGVAMAVYGLNGGLPGSGGGGHHRATFGKEWRKMGKLLGGVMGVGGRVLDGIRRGLE